MKWEDADVMGYRWEAEEKFSSSVDLLMVRMQGLFPSPLPSALNSRAYLVHYNVTHAETQAILM